MSAGTDTAKIGRHLRRTERKTFTNTVPIENTKTVTKRSFAPIQSEENMMIDKLNGEDFYDYSDYYDGLDGEHSDIDYNEIRDYFED